MSPAEVAVLVRGIAPAVRAALATALTSLAERVKALEVREPLVGPPGREGQEGLPGERGADGRDGRDGAPGKDGQDGAPGAPGQQGPAGVDGLQAMDFEPHYDGERTITLKWTRPDGSEHTRSWAMPVVLYRGVWAEGHPYEPGDQVTWAGAQWVAKTTTIARPGLATPDSRAWQLCCKAGRDGKPGKDGRDGLNGKDGKDYGRI